MIFVIFFGFTMALICTIAFLISSIFIITSYTGQQAKIEKNQKIYESLVYQYNNNIYEDSVLGKKELYDQIQEWNEDLAYYQNIQDDFWIGIYYPNIFDQFEFIEYK